MLRYEFKVVPAPRKGEKARGLKSIEDRFAQALTSVMNEMGKDGWDYVRSDSLPVDERVGFTGTKTTYQNMLVFRRVLQAATGAAGADRSAVSPVAEAAPAPALPRLGPADSPVGAAPTLGPAAKPDLAAE